MYLFIIPVIFGIIASIITWIIAPFFLAKRQYYVKSKYELLKIKITWCIEWFFGVAFTVAIILDKFFG
jgi:hypothetical protein